MEFYLDLFWHFKFECVLMLFNFKFQIIEALLAYKRTSTEQQIEVSDILYGSRKPKKDVEEEDGSLELKNSPGVNQDQ